MSKKYRVGRSGLFFFIFLSAKPEIVVHGEKKRFISLKSVEKIILKGKP
jgi:hypothetical protein